MSDVLDMPAEELLAELEEAAAEGGPGADRMLGLLLDVWAEAGLHRQVGGGPLPARLAPEAPPQPPEPGPAQRLRLHAVAEVAARAADGSLDPGRSAGCVFGSAAAPVSGYAAVAWVVRLAPGSLLDTRQIGESHDNASVLGRMFGGARDTP